MNPVSYQSGRHGGEEWGHLRGRSAGAPVLLQRPGTGIGEVSVTGFLPSWGSQSRLGNKVKLMNLILIWPAMRSSRKRKKMKV